METLESLQMEGPRLLNLLGLLRDQGSILVEDEGQGPVKQQDRHQQEPHPPVSYFFYLLQYSVHDPLMYVQHSDTG